MGRAGTTIGWEDGGARLRPANESSAATSARLSSCSASLRARRTARTSGPMMRTMPSLPMYKFGWMNGR